MQILLKTSELQKFRSSELQDFRAKVSKNKFFRNTCFILNAFFGLKNIGGQAVIEGVMMKAPRGWTVAVRNEKGEIHLKKELLSSLPSFFKLPFLRGVVALYQALVIGIRALEFSAKKAYSDEKEEALSSFSIAITIGVASLLAVALFIFLPLYLTKVTGHFVHIVSKNSFFFNLVDGIIRVGIFLLYIASIGLWKEMRRVFEYHGAEHKVIHAYESGKELILDNVRPFSPRHPRCGTSFLLIVMVTSILVFALIPQTWPFWAKFVSRVILIPLIAGLSYEILRLTARMKENPIMNILSLPGLMLQGLTTREPDDSQLEVAIIALKEVIRLEDGNA